MELILSQQNQCSQVVKDAYHIDVNHLRLLNFLDVCNYYYSVINFFKYLSNKFLYNKISNNFVDFIMTDSIPKKPLKKGSLVFVNREDYIKSIEALASDNDLPNYVFEGPGEILTVKDEYAQIRWRRPVPDVWLKLDQLKEYIQ